MCLMDKFATFLSNGAILYGRATDQGMIALSDALPQYPSWPEVSADSVLTGLKDAANSREVTHPTGQFQFEIPVPAPEKLSASG